MGGTLKFESRYRLLPSMSREYAKHVFCKSTRILGGIIMLVSAAALIISVAWAGYRLSDTTIFILCFTGGLLINNYYFLISLVVERQAKKRGRKQQPEYAIYFGNNIRMEDGKRSTTVDYQNISKFYNLPTLYVLEIGKDQAFLVPKDSFVIGESADFEAFIKEKMK